MRKISADMLGNDIVKVTVKQKAKTELDMVREIIKKSEVALPYPALPEWSNDKEVYIYYSNSALANQQEKDALLKQIQQVGERDE